MEVGIIDGAEPQSHWSPPRLIALTAAGDSQGGKAQGQLETIDFPGEGKALPS